MQAFLLKKIIKKIFKKKNIYIPNKWKINFKII